MLFFVVVAVVVVGVVFVVFVVAVAVVAVVDVPQQTYKLTTSSFILSVSRH